VNSFIVDADEAGFGVAGQKLSWRTFLSVWVAWTGNIRLCS